MIWARHYSKTWRVPDVYLFEWLLLIYLRIWKDRLSVHFITIFSNAMLPGGIYHLLLYWQTLWLAFHSLSSEESANNDCKADLSNRNARTRPLSVPITTMSPRTTGSHFVCKVFVGRYSTGNQRRGFLRWYIHSESTERSCVKFELRLSNSFVFVSSPIWPNSVVRYSSRRPITTFWSTSPWKELFIPYALQFVMHSGPNAIFSTCHWPAH